MLTVRSTEVPVFRRLSRPPLWALGYWLPPSQAMIDRKLLNKQPHIPSSLSIGYSLKHSWTICIIFFTNLPVKPCSIRKHSWTSHGRNKHYFFNVWFVLTLRQYQNIDIVHKQYLSIVRHKIKPRFVNVNGVEMIFKFEISMGSPSRRTSTIFRICFIRLVLWASVSCGFNLMHFNDSVSYSWRMVLSHNERFYQNWR